MRLKRHSRTLVALLVVAAALVTVAQDKFTTSLIPREVLFGNPERTNPQISPDGTQLAPVYELFDKSACDPRQSRA